MRIRPVRNKEDIRYERQRLLDHKKSLEASISSKLTGLRNCLKPVNLVKQVIDLVRK